MFPFKRLEISDYEIFRKHLDINRFMNSEYCFTTLFTWQNAFHIKYAMIENCVCAAGNWDGLEYYYFPLGERDDARRALLQLKKHCADNGRPLVLMSVSGDMAELLAEFGLQNEFIKEDRREFYDYVYKREKLVTLSGNKLHGKRNHYNYFTMNYDYKMEDITGANSGACREMLAKAIDNRSSNAADELDVTMMAFDYRNELRLTCGALTVDGEVAGVILAEDFFGAAVINIAKADVSIRGASVALFKLFLENNLTNCEYVNFTDDMGIDGLRRAKLSYAPDYFIEKYSFVGR